MKNFIATIFSKVDAIVEKNRQAYIKRQEDLKNLYKEENENLDPTIDCNGRFHAPCRGYRIPERAHTLFDFTNDYSETIFEKGAYLPMPINDEFNFFTGASYNFPKFEKFLLEGEMIEIFKQIKEKSEDKPFTLEFSRTWEYRNTTCCYVTVKSIWNSVISVFKNEMAAVLEKAKIEKEKKKAEERANKGVAPVGKSVVTGTVRHIKDDINVFAGRAVQTWKMLVVLENGATVFGTIPKSIIAVETGDVVTFTATFKNTPDDNTHSYYSRPSKASFKATETA